MVVCLIVCSAAAKNTDTYGPQSPTGISVIYPKKNQEIGPVDSTFILGSVTPGSELTINGVPVDVYRTGGFLAFLPVHSGPFEFRLWAELDGAFDTLVVPVVIADPRPIPSDSGVIIRKGSVRPFWNRTIRTGDEITVGFEGTVGCTPRFWVAGIRDTLGPFRMTELRRESLTSFDTYRRDALLERDALAMEDRAAPRRGQYRGLWVVPPALNGDTLRVIVELREETLVAGGEKARWPDTLLGPPTPPDSVTVAVKDTAPGFMVSVDNLMPRVVELTDSVQILRMGPRLGYLTIFQPYGVRARWWGEVGPWTILQPSPGYEAWIETSKTRLLPEGTPLPGSLIARLSTVANERSVTLRAGTSERLPFKVTVSENLRDVRILIFGATANTDWVEQDPADDLIEHISWSQIQPQIYEIEVKLAHPLWGYDARYDDRLFVVEFRCPPKVEAGLRGLTVAVDAGHSDDPGAIGPTGLMEKDANLQLALKVKDELKSLGARVVMTRIGNEDVPLYDRPEMAVAQDVDLFVSVHNNAVPDGINPRRRNGSSTYYYHPASGDLARKVHRRLVRATKLDDYGLTRGNFAVIRPTQYPSILIECAFIILPEQEEMLTDEGFLKRTANGIVTGISDFIHERLSP
jgi:N-acetylmuramoyl-L-alanine amidase